MIVVKFGGTSVKDAAAMKIAAKIIHGYNTPLVVVLSATAGTTNALLEMIERAAAGKLDEAAVIKNEVVSAHATIIRELGLWKNHALKRQIKGYFSTLEIMIMGVYYLKELTSRVKDAVAAYGELLSTRIMAAYLKSKRWKGAWFDVREIMKTDNQFMEAKPLREELLRLSQKKLRPVLRKEEVVITQGFIGSTREGLTSTLGRGGSDYSAALLGNVLDAKMTVIWTDVSGVLTADPRLIKAAFSQRDLSFKEAAELAYFGAKVLHPSTILPAMEKRIPVLVKNTGLPEDPGTAITFKSKRPGVVKAIAFRKNITVLTVESSRMFLAYGFLEKIFDIFARHRVSVDLISTSEITVSLTIDEEELPHEALEELKGFSKVKVAKDMALVSIVGENIKAAPGFLRKVFQAVDRIPIEMITFGASNVNLSLVVSERHMQETVERLHRAFFENKAK